MLIDGDECVSIAEAAYVKEVGVSALMFFWRQAKDGRSQPFTFKEAGGLVWITKASLKEWKPKSYRHFRPENISRERTA